MKKITLTTLFILLAVLGCTEEEEKVLATVGSEQILVKDFMQGYRPSVYPTEEEEREAKLKVLNRLIDDALLTAEARNRGYDKDSTLEDGIEATTQRALVNALYVAEVIDKSKASRTDAKRFYDADNTMLHLRIIHVESEDMANIIYQKIGEGVPFDTLAVKYSSHRSASRGGDMGKVPLSMFFETPEYKTISKLKEGDVTLPVQNEEAGFDIYTLIEKSEKENVQPFADVEEEMKKRVESLRQSKLSFESLERLLAEANIEYNDEALALLTKPQTELKEEDLSLWTIKIGGEVVDSVGSMMDVYLQYPQGLPERFLENAAERTAQPKALVKVATKRGLERDKTVKEAVATFVNSQIRMRITKEEITDKVEVGPQEAKIYYEEHPSEFFIPERRNLAIIRTPSYSDIQQAYSLLRNGKDFGEVASQFSDHSSKNRAGSIGFRRADDVSFKQFVEQGFKLSKGQYSRPFEVYNGYGIVKVLDVQQAYTRTFEAESLRIERTIRREKESSRREEFLEELKGRIPVEINEQLLMEIAKVEEKPEPQSQQQQ